jgi:hypothetical protein
VVGFSKEWVDSLSLSPVMCSVPKARKRRGEDEVLSINAGFGT